MQSYKIAEIIKFRLNYMYERNKKLFNFRIKNLKLFKAIILYTETANYFFEYFGITECEVILCKKVVLKNIIFRSRSYGERLKSNDCVVSFYHNDLLNSAIIECLYCTNSLYFIKLNMYKNTGNSINQFLSPLNESNLFTLINKVLNKYYLEVQLSEQFLVLPISCIQKKAIVIKIDNHTIVTEFFLDEHD